MQHLENILDEEAPTQRMSRNVGARVLVTGDDDAMRRLLVTALRDQGYDVQDATHSEELLRTLQGMAANDTDSDGVDLVVLDAILPGPLMLEVLRFLRAGGRSMPAILISASPTAELIRDAQRLNVHVLAKPFPLGTLTELALHCLNGEHTPGRR
jgi:CheY-like chemotaxis protein